MQYNDVYTLNPPQLYHHMELVPYDPAVARQRSTQPAVEIPRLWGFASPHWSPDYDYTGPIVQMRTTVRDLVGHASLYGFASYTNCTMFFSPSDFYPPFMIVGPPTTGMCELEQLPGWRSRTNAEFPPKS
jgi:hypothetical protein